MRDILHIDDLYSLISEQLNDINLHNGQIYNVGGGKELSVSLCELTRLCQEVVGKEIEITSIVENRNADVPYYISDCNKVKKVTGWSPKISLKEIVCEITTWINANKEILKPILS